MKHRSAIALLTLVTFATLGPRVHAAATIPLTIQEALYPGSMTGLARTADPGMVASTGLYVSAAPALPTIEGWSRYPDAMASATEEGWSRYPDTLAPIFPPPI